MRGAGLVGLLSLLLVATALASDAEAPAGGNCDAMIPSIRVAAYLANKVTDNVPQGAIKHADEIVDTIPVLKTVLDGDSWENFVAPKITPVLVGAVNPTAVADSEITDKVSCIIEKLIVSLRSPDVGANSGVKNDMGIPETLGDEEESGGILDAVVDTAGDAVGAVAEEAVTTAVSGLDSATDGFPSKVVRDADALVDQHPEVKEKLGGKNWEEVLAPPVSFAILMAFPDLAKDKKALRTLAGYVVKLIQAFRESGGETPVDGGSDGALVEAKGNNEIKEDTPSGNGSGDMEEMQKVRQVSSEMDELAKNSVSHPEISPLLSRMRTKLHRLEAALGEKGSHKYIACSGTKVPPESGKAADESLKCTPAGDAAQVIGHVNSNQFNNPLRVIQAGSKEVVNSEDLAGDGEIGIKLLTFDDDGALNEAAPTGVKEATPMKDTPFLKKAAALKMLEGAKAPNTEKPAPQPSSQPPAPSPDLEERVVQLAESLQSE